MGPRWPQDQPRPPQDRLQTTLDRHKVAQDRRKTAQDHPKPTQDLPKTAQRAPKTAPRQPQEASVERLPPPTRVDVAREYVRRAECWMQSHQAGRLKFGAAANGAGKGKDIISYSVTSLTARTSGAEKTVPSRGAHRHLPAVSTNCFVFRLSGPETNPHSQLNLHSRCSCLC